MSSTAAAAAAAAASAYAAEPTEANSKKRSRKVAEAEKELTDEEEDEEKHLDWSDKQRRILTADGQAVHFYTAERGFSFHETELPHYWLSQGQTRCKFREWAQQNWSTTITTTTAKTKSLIVGAWKRPLFYGTWEFSTDRDEHVYNVQTNTLFVDLRLPVTRLVLPCKTTTTTTTTTFSLQNLSGPQLRRYARQHIFAGYSVVQEACFLADPSKTSLSAVAAAAAAFDQVCVRHHCIDWNYVGTPRNRPNKWWIQRQTKTRQQLNDDDDDDKHNQCHKWKEWAYSTDDARQHYYCELWQQLSPPTPKDDDPPRTLAFQKSEGRDGVLVVVQDHFSFCLGRGNNHSTWLTTSSSTTTNNNNNKSSLVETIDDCVEQGDFDTARQWLSIQGGHGFISKGWLIDAAVEFWRQGTPLWTKNDVRLVPTSDINKPAGRDQVVIVAAAQQQQQQPQPLQPWWESCTLYWKEEPWHLVECSLNSLEELEEFFQNTLHL